MQPNFSQIDQLALTLNNLGGAPALAAFNSNDPMAFRKALTVTSNYTGYNLERAVKRFLPAYTIMRQRVAVDTGPVGPQSGPQARFKAQLGFGSFDFGAAMGTPFAANGNDTDPDAIEFAADYKQQSVHGAVQVPAIDFGRQFDDPLQAQMMMNMAAISRIDELLTLGGNESALDTPVVTAAGGGTGTTFAAGTYKIGVSALTVQGAQKNNTGANTTPQVDSAGANITNTYMGETVPGYKSGNLTLSGSELYIDVTWPAIKGAVAYKLYMSSVYNDTTDVYLLDPATELGFGDANASTALMGSGAMQFSGQKWVGVNHVRILAYPAGTTPPPTVDGSASANQFEGMVAWSAKTSIYGTSLTSFDRVFIDQAGALLTTDTAGGVKEINQALQKMALLYHTGPTAIVASPATVSSITARIASQSMMRLDLTQSQDHIMGGIMVGGYLNRFAQDYGLKRDIDVISHVYMPDGLILLLSENLPPATYRYANDGRAWAMDVLRPYNYFPLASTNLNINFNIWFIETLKCFYPLAQGAIAGIRTDS